MKTGKTVIEISPKTFVIASFFIVGLIALFRLRQVILILFLSLIITSAVRPFVERLHTKKIPRSLTVLTIYFFVLALIAAIGFLVASSLAPQLAALVRNIPDLILGFLNRMTTTFPSLESLIDVDSINRETVADFFGDSIRSNTLLQGFGRAFGIVSSAFEVTIVIVSTAILSIYMLSRRVSVLHQVANFLPEKTKVRFEKLIPEVEAQLGAWLRGQVTLMFIMGFLSWLGLTIIGVEYALPIAIVIALLELIPNIGPAFGWVISTVVAIGSGAGIAQVFMVFGWSIFIQQFEHLVLVPKIFQRVVGLDPVVTIIGIISFSILFGFGGVIIAVPVMAVAQIVWRHVKKVD